MKDKFLCLLAQFDKETQEKLNGYYDILQQNGFVGNQTKKLPYHFTLGKEDIDFEKQLINLLDKICANTLFGACTENCLPSKFGATG